MKDKFSNMPLCKTYIDFSKNIGKACFKRHSYGIGGVNSMPMPDKIVRGMRELKPKLIRIFIQEFFYIVDENDKFDFDKLDLYLKAIHDTGADIFASICIKPKSLYPVVDENIWMPSDVERWQKIISVMVNRYSVENRFITYWGIGNELNIGEYGGCSYKINDVKDYFEYYKITADAVLKTCPDLKIGGPSFAGVNDETFIFVEKFILLCKNNGIQLNFVSYNVYSDDIHHHVNGARTIRDIADKYDKNIEVYVTEMNIGIGGETSIEEKAYDSKRAAGLAAIIMEYNDKVPDVGTFHYHIYDQYCDPNEFRPFYSRHRYMANHWNDEPHRLGLFDLDGNPRPQYHMYKLLDSLAEQRAEVYSDNNAEDIRVIASYDSEKVILLMVNYNSEQSRDTMMSVYFKNCFNDTARLNVQRIDNIGEPGLKTTEDRLTYIHDDFWFSIFIPEDSCVMVTIIRSDTIKK